MAKTADFELVQAVRGMDGRISDPSARMTSKMDRSKQRRGLGNPMAKSREVFQTRVLEGSIAATKARSGGRHVQKKHNSGERSEDTAWLDAFQTPVHV